MVGIKRENWKGKYVWVVRDDKGKIKSWSNVKDSQYNTKRKAYNKYKESNTLNQHITKILAIGKDTNLVFSKNKLFSDKTQKIITYEIFKDGQSIGQTIQGFGKFGKVDEKGIEKSAWKRGLEEGLYEYDDNIILKPKSSYYQSYRKR